MATKKSNSNSSTKTAIQNNIKKIMKELDEDSLLFLLEQAQVLKHNMEVDKINKEILEARSKEGGIVSEGVKRSSDLIKVIADQDGKNFIIEINNNRKFLTRDEFRKIVEICYKGTSANLYNWLYKERKDILIDCGIKEKNSLILNKLIDLIKSKYKLKQG